MRGVGSASIPADTGADARGAGRAGGACEHRSLQGRYGAVQSYAAPTYPRAATPPVFRPPTTRAAPSSAVEDVQQVKFELVDVLASRSGVCARDV